MDAIEDDRFAQELRVARESGDMDAFARTLSGRLRQMDKRARAANVRADQLEADLQSIRAELPESLRAVTLKYGVRSLRIAHEAHDRRFWRYGYALRAAMQFVDRSAGEGLEWLETEDGPGLDAADVCERIAKLLGMEPGDATWMEMLKPIPEDAEARLQPTQSAASQGRQGESNDT